MDLMSAFLIVIATLFLRLLLEEFWTVVQIAKSCFTKRIDLRKTYGSWAIVTGCTDGIGKEFAFELASRGLNIILISRNQWKLKNVASEIQNKYKVNTKIIVCDFSRGREVYDNIKKTLEDVEVGILINNVGIQYSYPMYFCELPEDELWSLLNINIGAVTQMTRIVLPKMLNKKRGAIVNISSGSKLQPLPFMNLYAASKIFVDFFTQALRSEYKNSEISIQSLCPFYVTTKINHFSAKLLQANLFIPTPSQYVKSALDTLGVLENTTGYWPHRVQYMIHFIVPTWIKVFFGGLLYKLMRKNYMKRKLNN